MSIDKLPKISIIMSVRNDNERVSQAIESILNQTYKNFEFLILDDCSDDNTSDTIQNYLQIDNRIKYFRNTSHLGLTKSLNKLIDMTETNIIARQDSDDYSLKNRFIVQINELLNKNLDVVGSLAIRKNSKTRIPRFSYIFPNRIVVKYKNPFIHGTLVFRKDVLIGLNKYDEKFVYAQDYKLMKEILDAKYKVKIIKKPLYILNMQNNISTLNKREQDYYAMCVKKNLIPNNIIF